MRQFQKLLGGAFAGLLLAGCAGADSRPDRAATCPPPQHTSPPSAATPSGPTAATIPTPVNPPAGYPPLMNPTAPITVAATPSNIDDGGAKMPSTAGSGVGNDCDRLSSRASPAVYPR